MITTKSQAEGRSAIPKAIRPQIVASAKQPPTGDEWLDEIKYDGHRLIAIVPGPGQLKLISRIGYDRTPLFRGPFRELAASGRSIVLDGEIAVPDERGVTHVD
jgi:bifunctional non-homologous end joining protein LigD